MNKGGEPFLLDSEGNVWGFHDPSNVKGLVKILIPEPIKKINPYIALSQNGHVYTWDDNLSERLQEYFKKKSSNGEEEKTDDTQVDYTAAKRIESLSNVFDIAADYPRFTAFYDNTVYEWSAERVPPAPIIAMPKVTVQLPNPALPETSMATNLFGTVILLQNRNTIGWGGSFFSLNGFSTPALPIRFTLPLSAKKIILAYSTAIVLTDEGKTLFWKGCASREPEKCVWGRPFPFNDVVDVSVAFLSPGVYLRKDGTIWLANTPNGIKRDGNMGFEPDVLLPRQVKGMNVKAVGIASCPSSEAASLNILALGEDGSLWGSFYDGEMKKLDVNLGQ